MKKRIPLITAVFCAAAFTKGAYCYAGDVQETPEIVTLQPVEGNPVLTSELASEVAAVNADTMSRQMSGVVDVSSITQMSAEQVRYLINSYYIPDRCLYLDGVLRGEGDLDYVINRRNLSGLSDPVSLRYGVLTENTAVRTYPCWQKLSEEPEEESADYFQESMFLLGEGVVILHQTADEIWSFVQGTNDAGWIETDNIAFCKREDMRLFSDADSFVIVTDDQLLAGEEELRMGTRLPLSRVEGDYAVVWLPQSNENGNLYLSEMRINLEGGIHIGYLSLSHEEIVRQAVKLLDMPYGWGDSGGFMDCSSSLNAVYRCFGVLLPRKTDRLMYAGTSTDISWMNKEEKLEYILAQEKGCILLFGGHAALYVGTEESGQPVILHNVTCYSSDQVTVTEAYKCVLTPLDIYFPDGTSYLSLCSWVVSF